MTLSIMDFRNARFLCIAVISNATGLDTAANIQRPNISFTAFLLLELEQPVL